MASWQHYSKFMVRRWIIPHVATAGFLGLCVLFFPSEVPNPDYYHAKSKYDEVTNRLNICKSLEGRLQDWIARWSPLRKQAEELQKLAANASTTERQKYEQQLRDLEESEKGQGLKRELDSLNSALADNGLSLSSFQETDENVYLDLSAIERERDAAQKEMQRYAPTRLGTPLIFPLVYAPLVGLVFAGAFATTDYLASWEAKAMILKDGPAWMRLGFIVAVLCGCVGTVVFLTQSRLVIFPIVFGLYLAFVFALFLSLNGLDSYRDTSELIEKTKSSTASVSPTQTRRNKIAELDHWYEEMRRGIQSSRLAEDRKEAQLVELEEQYDDKLRRLMQENVT